MVVEQVSWVISPMHADQGMIASTVFGLCVIVRWTVENWFRVKTEQSHSKHYCAQKAICFSLVFAVKGGRTFRIPWPLWISWVFEGNCQAYWWGAIRVIHNVFQRTEVRYSLVLCDSWSFQIGTSWWLWLRCRRSIVLRGWWFNDWPGTTEVCKEYYVSLEVEESKRHSFGLNVDTILWYGTRLSMNGSISRRLCNRSVW